MLMLGRRFSRLSPKSFILKELQSVLFSATLNLHCPCLFFFFFLTHLEGMTKRLPPVLSRTSISNELKVIVWLGSRSQCNANGERHQSVWTLSRRSRWYPSPPPHLSIVSVWSPGYSCVGLGHVAKKMLKIWSKWIFITIS